DMRQAIRLVRETQGPDAVILSSRSVDGGIEIISAIDFDQDLVAGMAARPDNLQREHIPSRPVEAAGEVDAPDLFAVEEPAAEAPPRPEIVWAQDPAISELQREIKQMKDLLQDQLSQLAWSDFSRREPLRAQLL